MKSRHLTYHTGETVHATLNKQFLNKVSKYKLSRHSWWQTHHPTSFRTHRLTRLLKRHTLSLTSLRMNCINKVLIWKQQSAVHHRRQHSFRFYNKTISSAKEVSRPQAYTTQRSYSSLRSSHSVDLWTQRICSVLFEKRSHCNIQNLQQRQVCSSQAKSLHKAALFSKTNRKCWNSEDLRVKCMMSSDEYAWWSWITTLYDW